MQRLPVGARAHVHDRGGVGRVGVDAHDDPRPSGVAVGEGGVVRRRPGAPPRRSDTGAWSSAPSAAPAPNCGVHLDRLVGELVEEVGPPVPLQARPGRARRTCSAAPGTASASASSSGGPSSPTGCERVSARSGVAGVAPDDRRTSFCRGAPPGTAAPAAPRASANKPLSSSGACGMSSRTSAAPPSLCVERPRASARRPTVPTGCSRNMNDVTTPKLPPPPRSAQNRSGCSSALAVTKRAVGEHHVGREQVVDRQPVPAGQIADPAAQGSPPTPVVDRIPQAWPGRRRGGVVDVAPGAPPSTRTVRARDRPGPPASPQIDDQRRRRPRPARPRVAATAHRDADRARGRSGPRRSRPRRRPPGDRGRTPLDHRVVDRARLVVPSSPGRITGPRMAELSESKRAGCAVVVRPYSPVGPAGIGQALQGA